MYAFPSKASDDFDGLRWRLNALDVVTGSRQFGLQPIGEGADVAMLALVA